MGGPDSPYLLVQQHCANTGCLLFPCDHNVVWSSGQVATGKLSHGLPGAVKAQQLEVVLVQILSPCFSVPSWVEKRGDQPI